MNPPGGVSGAKRDFAGALQRIPWLARPCLPWLHSSAFFVFCLVLLGLFVGGCVSSPPPTVSLSRPPPPPIPTHRTVLPPTPAAIELPAEIVGGHFLILTQWDANGPWRFLVDTGSAATLVSPEFARRYATDEPAGDMPSIHVISPDGGSRLLPGVRVSTIMLGAARFENVTALVYDCDALSAQFGRKIDGILGFSLFRDTILTLDYPQARLRLLPSGSTATLAGVVATLVGQPGLPMVTVQIGDHPLDVLLDSGSNGMLQLNQTGLEPRYAEPPQPGVTVSTLTGDRLQEIGRLADSLTVGGVVFTRPVVELTGQTSALGVEVLRQFRLSFDQRRGLVGFERSPVGPIAAGPVRSVGLSFRRSPAYWRVLSVVPGSPADTAGIETGDLIVRINGEAVGKWDLNRYDQLVGSTPAIDFVLLNGRVETPVRIPTFDLVP